MTSQAPELSTFLVGRAIAGAGAAGILAVSIVLALELGGKKRRGLCIGLINGGFSLGTSLGAVLAGGLVPYIGWVSSLKQLRCEEYYSPLMQGRERCSPYK